MGRRAPRLETVVLRVDPVRERRRRLLLVLSILLLPVLAGVGGYWLAGSDDRALEAELRELRQLHGQVAALQERLAIASTGAEVDRHAVEALRIELRAEQALVAELREELSFYRSLMVPEERERGLGIHSWELYPLATPGHYQFKLVLYQLARQHAQLQGSVAVTVVGRSGDAETSVPLQALSPDIEQQEIRLRFTYFQNIEGELLLPEGFQPLRVDVSARSSQPRQAQVERSFGWVVQES